MRRLSLLPLILFASCTQQQAPASTTTFTVVETPMAEMRIALEQGRVTSRELVEQYLMRIALYEDRINATLTVNPKALKEADERDADRRQGNIRGPLHGIPIALKDNVHTTDMPTTGGAAAFEGLVPPYDATLTKNLRDAGAIIIAKTNLTELANWWREHRPPCLATTTPSAGTDSIRTTRDAIHVIKLAMAARH